MQAHRIEGPFAARERILVLVSPSPNSAYLIRWARRAAFNLKAEWTALNIETGKVYDETERERLKRNMNLARQLGAEVVTVPSENVAEAVLKYARLKNITQIVMGKSGLGTRLQPLRRASITERILQKSGDIDVVVVQDKGRPPVHRPAIRTSRARLERLSYPAAILVIALVTAFGRATLPVIGYRAVSIVYLLAIIGLALFIRTGAVLTAATISALLWNFFFIPPHFVFTIGKLEDVLMFFMYFIAAAVIAFLMSKIRTHEKLLSVREKRVSTLYNFSQALAKKQSLDEITATSLEHVSRYFEANTVVFLRNDSNDLDRKAHSLVDHQIDDKEFSVARWCFSSRNPCGKYTDSLSSARFHYIPLLTPDSAVGVLGIQLGEGRVWMPDQEDLLQALVRNLSLSVERVQLARINQKNLMVRESERLSRILLRSISHELRTPLTTIKGSITALMDGTLGDDREVRGTLLSETLIAVDKLNSTFENLLSMNRLESGMLKLKRAETDVDDLVSVVVNSLRQETKDHPLSVNIGEAALPVSIDFVLMVQVLSNLVQNSVNHTPPGTAIELLAKENGRDLRVTVSDRGPGVSREELPHVFDMFFRGRNAVKSGVGLGLSICKGIVEAHGGTIAASLNGHGGLSVDIVLPGCVVLEKKEIGDDPRPRD
jgi:two-component system sensor histidine kinase KdpD